MFMTSVRGTKLLVVAGGSIKVPLDLLHVVIFLICLSVNQTQQKRLTFSLSAVLWPLLTLKLFVIGATFA